jgi:hypothetical protein
MNSCDSCAFRTGSVTHDQEPYNALRGLLCALGGRPFHCHHLNGADHHKDQQYLLQRLPRVRAFLKTLPELQGEPVLEGETVKLCEGWKEQVREYKAKHLFDDPAVRRVRHLAADRALEVIDLFMAAPDESPQKARLNRELESLIYLLAAPPESEAA